MNKNLKKTKITPREGIIDYYLRDIRPTRPDADKERELISIYYSDKSTPAQKLKARNDIVTMNQKFVLSLAKGYCNGNNDLLMDLVSQGNLGMMEAFQNYSPESGNRFCTFAKFYICRSITNYLADENLLVRPTNNMRITPKVKAIEEEFEKREHRKPTVDEVEMILEEQYGITLSKNSDITPVTIDRIDAPADESEEDDERYLSRMMDFNMATSVDNDYEDESYREGLSYEMVQAMSVLTPRETEVIKMAFGMDGYLKNYKNFEIGEAIGKTAECARQIKNTALKKLRAACLSKNINLN